MLQLCLIVRAHLRLRIDALSPSAPNPISLFSTPYPPPLPVLPVPRFSGSGAEGSPNSFRHNLLSDPHPLTPIVSIFYENIGGRGASTIPSPSTFEFQPPCLPKSFSCNTYGPPRQCCKQKTYSLAKPFRCNTYKKHGVHPSSQVLSSPPAPLPHIPSSVRSSKFRILQTLCLPLLRKLPGCIPTIPILELFSLHSPPRHTSGGLPEHQ